MEVFVDDETKLTLHGLQQYYCKLKDSEKNRKLFDLLDVLEFNQVSVVILLKGVGICYVHFICFKSLLIVNKCSFIFYPFLIFFNLFSKITCVSCPLLNPPMSAFSSTNRKICKTQQFLLYSSQVVIFVKSVARCVALSQLLVEQNFPAIAIHRGMAQEERLVLRHFRKKSVFLFLNLSYFLLLSRETVLIVYVFFSQAQMLVDSVSTCKRQAKTRPN